jgi:hypothetical protein
MKKQNQMSKLAFRKASITELTSKSLIKVVGGNIDLGQLIIYATVPTGQIPTSFQPQNEI